VHGPKLQDLENEEIERTLDDFAAAFGVSHVSHGKMVFFRLPREVRLGSFRLARGV
jgi:hypothetical protein